MTLADKIRSMTDEELAHFLCNFINECAHCPASEHCYFEHNGMKAYLQEEYKE